MNGSQLGILDVSDPLPRFGCQEIDSSLRPSRDYTMARKHPGKKTTLRSNLTASAAFNLGVRPTQTIPGFLGLDLTQHLNFPRARV